MAKQKENNLMDTVLETQKNMVSKMVENTKKLSNGNTFVNDTLNKGTEWYNNWLESQKNMFENSSKQAETLNETVQSNTQKINDELQNLQNKNLQSIQQLWEMNQNWFKAATEQAKSIDTNNPMATFQNWTNQWNNLLSQWNNTQNIQNQYQNWTKNWMNQNPFSMDAFKSNSDAVNNWFNQYTELMNSSLANLQNTLKGNTPQDAFKNMMNVNQGFLRFAEIWTPLMSHIQNNTFNMDMFKKATDATSYKGLFDQLFGLMPDYTSKYIKDFAEIIKNNAKNFNAADYYNQMKTMSSSFMPANFNSNAMFEGATGAYNNFRNSLNSIFAPMGKMIGNNEWTKNLDAYNELADKLAIFNIKSAEMQHMIYEAGTKVMDKVAESILNKQENGVEVGNIMSLYQEWLNISDNEFVKLFESDEYSAIMADVASLKMKLTKEMNSVVEKSLVNIPVATRSEVEELYKVIYDLKKEVRQLSRMLDMETEVEEDTNPKASAKKTKK